MIRFSIFWVVWDIDVRSVAGEKPVSLESFGRINSDEHFSKDAEKKLEGLRGNLGPLLTKG